MVVDMLGVSGYTNAVQRRRSVDECHFFFLLFKKKTLFFV